MSSHSRKRLELLGRRFGMLVVVERAGYHKNGRSLVYRCVCDCGGSKVVIGSNLNNGLTRSCGCLRERAARVLCRMRNSGNPGKLGPEATWFATPAAEPRKPRKPRAVVATIAVPPEPPPIDPPLVVSAPPELPPIVRVPAPRAAVPAPVPLPVRAPPSAIKPPSPPRPGFSMLGGRLARPASETTAARKVELEDLVPRVVTGCSSLAGAF